MSESIKFERALEGMQIPDSRRAGTPENARWFLRNGVMVNRDHPKILLAICHARRIGL